MKFKSIRFFALAVAAIILSSTVCSEFSQAEPDKLEELTVADLSLLVDEYASARDSKSAIATLEEIFARLPDSNQSFERVVQRYQVQIPLTVSELRRIIRQTLRVSTASSKLRMRALELLYERMEKHAALATGAHGRDFLTYFGIWTHELIDPRERMTGKAGPSEENDLALRIDTLYRKNFSAMMCAHLFKSSN